MGNRRIAPYYYDAIQLLSTSTTLTLLHSILINDVINYLVVSNEKSLYWIFVFLGLSP